MKNLDLNGLGVQEMNAEEVTFQNGGSMAGPSASYYMSSAQMNAMGRAIGDGIDWIGGFFAGLFSL